MRSGRFAVHQIGRTDPTWEGRAVAWQEVAVTPATRALARMALTEARRDLPSEIGPVTVAFFRCVPDVLHGFYPHDRSTLWLRADLTPWGIRHNLRHELAHLWGETIGAAPTEGDCDAFARGDVLPLRLLLVGQAVDQAMTKRLRSFGTVAGIRVRSDQ